MHIIVNVIPWSSRESIAITGTNIYGHTVYRVKTTAKPIDNAANYAVIDILSKHFALPKRRIQLVGWDTSRTKSYIIDMPENCW